MPETPTPPASVQDLLRAAQPCLWTNPGRQAEVPPRLSVGTATVGVDDMQAAVARFGRFAGLLAELFPELQASGGVIESPLVPAPALGQALGLGAEQGALWVKCDHLLPVAGSIKARGGIHEVLEFAETLALQHGLVAPGGDYRALARPEARALLGRYQVAVGSTGNLGLSIGVAASKLGFRAAVHMSADAKDWKKERLRRRGVEVVEHAGDYEQAVAAGRAQAASDPFCHFVDDERSLSLLQGYSAAAPALQRQLAAAGISVDATHPLFVYLPCGVGGAPAGITFGLRQVLGPHVHCFFAEPVQSPCFLAQMLAGPHDHPSVYDWGLSNQTEADGLAVPRASLLAASLMHPLLSGVTTVQDATLFQHLALAHDTENLRIEPSAAAGFSGPAMLTGTLAGRAWLQAQGLEVHLPQATHLAWTTGGLFVPGAEYDLFLQRGRSATSA
ncbi:MAG: D-serine ammonia-lyase [Giesbergeria sp.]|nr:D-serine ammonia-lyase [Giesbergeria sp.]